MDSTFAHSWWRRMSLTADFVKRKIFPAPKDTGKSEITDWISLGTSYLWQNCSTLFHRIAAVRLGETAQWNSLDLDFPSNMNFTNATEAPSSSRPRLKVMDTKIDLIIGVFVLILSIGFTFVCCVLMAMKCSKNPKNQYHPTKRTKEPYEEVPQKEGETTALWGWCRMFCSSQIQISVVGTEEWSPSVVPLG